MLIPTIDYIFLKYKDVYTLKNISITPFNYSVSRIVNKVSSIVSSGTVLSGTTATLSLGNFDGQYQLNIVNTITSATPTNIRYFPTLLKTIIEKTKDMTCRECGSCDKCEDSNTQLSLLAAVLSYSYLNSPTYNNYFEDININLNDLVTNRIVKYLGQNFVLGKGNITPLFIQIVGMHYLSFYYTDIREAKDADEVAYLKIKYNAADIITCLNSIGIVVPDTEEVLGSGVDIYYWQLTSSSDTISNLPSPLTDNYLESKAKDTLERFNIGKIINYSNIAKIAFAIKNSLSSNFAIYDSLNNDVTSQFDKIYNSATKTVLFVSKANYSYSNIFFKIKNLNV